MFPIVRPVDARGIEIAVAEVRSAVRLAREPVGMRLVQPLTRAIRIHAREDDDAILVRRLREIAKEIAIAEKFRPAVHRYFSRIVRHDAAGVDDHALCLGLLPVFAPPWDVVPRRIDLGDVRLHPADGASIPGLRADRRRRLCGGFQGRPCGLAEHSRAGQRGGRGSGLREKSSARLASAGGRIVPFHRSVPPDRQGTRAPTDSRMARPAARRLSRRISEYLRDRMMPCAPPANVALTA